MRRKTFARVAAFGLQAACVGLARGADPLEEPTQPFSGPRTEVLARGKIESLPPDVDLVATIVRCTMKDATRTERHFSTIEYVLAGEPTLTFGDGFRVTLRPGDAMWIPPIETHVHGVANAELAETLDFALRPASERPADDPSCRSVFRGERIPQPPVQRYYESLVSIELPPNYATAPVTLDAMQTFYVLSGRTSLRVDDAERKTLEARDAAYVAPLHRYEWGTGAEPATVLVYSIYGESPAPSPSPG